MKSSHKLISVVLASLLLCGCSSANTPKEEQSSDTPQTEAFTEKTSDVEIPEDTEQRTLPVLSIETVSRDENVMDFVEKPVASHVAEQIASWTPNYEMPPAPYYEDCTVTLNDDKGKQLLSPAEAKVKVRGNWTTTYDKKPLRISFTEKQSMLGLNDGAKQKNWLLLAEYKDASMLRNKASLYASRQILGKDGLYSADSELVSVEINGKYYGIYLLTEMQQASSSRVEIDEAKKDYNGTDIGYFMEFDGYFTNEDELHSFSLDFADNAPLIPYNGKDGDGYKVSPLSASKIDPKKPVGITLKSRVNNTEQHDFIENYVNNVYRIMYEAAYNDKAFIFDDSFSAVSETYEISPQQAVEKVVNIDSLADMYVISELTCDADIYWSSFYMDADFSENGTKKLTFEAPWDFDSSMGSKDRCLDGEGFYASNLVPDVNGGRKGGGEYDTVNPWLCVLAYEDWFQDIVKEKWTSAYDSGVFSDTCQLIADDSAQLHDEFKKNYDKWNNILNISDSLRNELSEPAAECTNQKEAAEFLLKWLSKRVEWLNSQWHK